MKEYARQHDTADRKRLAQSQRQPVDDAAIQAATETISNVAAVSRNLRRARVVIEKLLQRASGMRDLSFAHWLVLVHLPRDEVCEQGVLHSTTGISAGYLTRLLDDLDAKGMIVRRRSSKDRRQILLTLTDPGKEATSRLLASLSQNHCSQHLRAIGDVRSSLQSLISLATAQDRSWALRESNG